MTGAGLARHDLVQIGADAWEAACETPGLDRQLTPEQVAMVTGWAAAGRPAISRRPLPGDPPGRLTVGVPLPPSLGKLRVALSVPTTATWLRRTPPELNGVARTAPQPWAATIEALTGLGRLLGLRPRVFGALLWQYETGLQYLHHHSDLDLLWQVSDPGTARSLLDGLRRIDDASPVRIDGEVLTPGGAVNWRELASAWGAGGAVLVKTADGAHLDSCAALFAGGDSRC